MALISIINILHAASNRLSGQPGRPGRGQVDPPGARTLHFRPHAPRKKLETYLKSGGNAHHLAGALPRAEVLPQVAENRKGTQEKPQEGTHRALQTRPGTPRRARPPPSHQQLAPRSPPLPPQGQQTAAPARAATKRFAPPKVAYSRPPLANAGTRPVRGGVLPRLPHQAQPGLLPPRGGLHRPDRPARAPPRAGGGRGDLQQAQEVILAVRGRGRPGQVPPDHQENERLLKRPAESSHFSPLKNLFFYNPFSAPQTTLPQSPPTHTTSLSHSCPPYFPPSRLFIPPSSRLILKSTPDSPVSKLIPQDPPWNRVREGGKGCSGWAEIKTWSLQFLEKVVSAILFDKQSLKSSHNKETSNHKPVSSNSHIPRLLTGPHSKFIIILRMHANKQFITVEASERDRDPNNEYKATKQSILEVESIKEVRRVNPPNPNRPFPLRPRLQASGSAADSRRDPSPSLSALTVHEDYFREMEAAILSENHNLKEHNQFLKGQIETMFERERRYKSHLNAHRSRVTHLETANAHLTQQLHLLISSILAEIERIQLVIQEHQDLERSLYRPCLEPSPKHSDLGASETESTIHRDLEDLKAKVTQIYNSKYTTLEPPPFHRTEYRSESSSRREELMHETFALETIKEGRERHIDPQVSLPLRPSRADHRPRKKAV